MAHASVLHNQAATDTTTTLDAEASDTIDLHMAEINISMEGLGYAPGDAAAKRVPSDR